MCISSSLINLCSSLLCASTVKKLDSFFQERLEGIQSCFMDLLSSNDGENYSSSSKISIMLLVHQYANPGAITCATRS